MFAVRSPVAGRSQAVSDVPDPVFAAGLVGPGMAVRPRAGWQTAVAPVAGRLVKLHPHAYVVQTESGHGVLVHLGIDTVHMQGEGFELQAREHDEVRCGDAIVSWDPGRVEASGRSAACTVVVLDCDPTILLMRAVDTDVEPNQVLYEVDC
jgi:PTS system glucose-specific IIA component